ncbi:hypothetical protein J6590_007989 [Homalodisca vitripennis]|nr:hypothetical protein J6590_007989 [Homalodisca vitripennis]
MLLAERREIRGLARHRYGPAVEASERRHKENVIVPRMLPVINKLRVLSRRMGRSRLIIQGLVIHVAICNCFSPTCHSGALTARVVFHRLVLSLLLPLGVVSCR